MNNKNEPENQKQHRIPKVYLKKFGFKKDSIHYISVFDKKQNKIQNFNIDEFSTSVNIFDLPYTSNMIFKRNFENNCGLLENRYQTIISNICNQKRLIEKDSQMLNHFIASILCRNVYFRMFIQNIINDDNKFNQLIKEISSNQKDINELKSIEKHIKSNNGLNIVIGYIAEHLAKTFHLFDKVIIQNYENSGWITSDNPVCIDLQGCEDFLIPIESEIYFPLSKEFCLFMYHPKSLKKNNPLRDLKKNAVNNIDNKIYDKVIKKIIYNISDYIILGQEI